MFTKKNIIGTTKLNKLLISSFVFIMVMTVLLFSSCFQARVTNAQGLGVGVAKYLPIQGDVSDGDLVALVSGKYIKGTKEHADKVVGVVVEQPALELETDTTSGVGYYPVVDSGSVYVKVTTQNGDIRSGDLLTLSTFEGVAMKANLTDYVVGVAAEDYTEADPVNIRLIRMTIHLNYSHGGNDVTTSLDKAILDLFSEKEIWGYAATTDIVKHLLAAIIVTLFVVISLINIGRIGKESVKSVGRNPRASKLITDKVVLNVFVTVVILIIGLFIGYIILNM